MNYEQNKQYIFPIVASITRDVTLKAYASVVVNVLNGNDNPPSFSSANIDISESHLVGTSVYKVEGSDLDGDKIIYTIVYGADGTFNMSRNGVISLTAPLNYDNKNSYVLKLNVSDGLHTVSGFVAVNVIATSKPPPKFANALYRASISEATPVGRSVLQLKVHHTIAPTTFTIDGSGKDTFLVDGNGTIRIAAVLNYEIMSQHIFTVTVSLIFDRGT